MKKERSKRWGMEVIEQRWLFGCLPAGGEGGREMGGEDCEEQCANWSPILTGWNNILRGGGRKL